MNPSQYSVSAALLNDPGGGGGGEGGGVDGSVTDYGCGTQPVEAPGVRWLLRTVRIDTMPIQ